MDIIRPELKTQRKRRQIAWVSLGMLLVVVLVLIVLNLEPALPEVPRSSAWIGTVERGSLTREVRGPGSLVPKVIRWIPAESGGRVERIVAKPGVQVEPGTVLVEVSNPELAEQVEAARWAVEAAQADRDSLAAELDRSLLEAQASLATLRSDAESAGIQAEAEKELSERGIVSVIQYRQSQMRVELLQTRLRLEGERIERLRASNIARLAAEGARVEQARRLVRRRQDQLEGLRILAGMTGVLQEIAVEPGQQVSLGGNVARVAQPEELIAELRIAEAQAREIQIDQLVRVDTRNGIVSGSVVRIDPAVQNATVQVDVTLTGELPPGVRPDLSVDGMIELERLEDVLHLGRPSSGQPEGRASLYRLVDDKVAERVEVEFGRASVGRIEIRSGLAEGDRVILSDMSQWAQHHRVVLK